MFNKLASGFFSRGKLLAKKWVKFYHLNKLNDKEGERVDICSKHFSFFITNYYHQVKFKKPQKLI